MANPIAATLELIAAKAKTYPAFVKDYGRTISIFASVIKTYVDAQIAAIPPSGGGAFTTKTAAFTAEVNTAYIVPSGSTAGVITLPDITSDGDWIEIQNLTTGFSVAPTAGDSFTPFGNGASSTQTITPASNTPAEFYVKLVSNLSTNSWMVVASVYGSGD